MLATTALRFGRNSEPLTSVSERFLGKARKFVGKAKGEKIRSERPARFLDRDHRVVVETL